MENRTSGIGDGERRWIAGLLAAAFVVASGFGAEAVAGEADDGAFPWVVEPQRAAELIESGEVSVLDTRSDSQWNDGRLPGAVRVDWEAFTPSTKADRGELSADDAALQEKLRTLGIDGDRPVLVVGNPPHNWGEDGRIVWMLRTLGHDRAGLVDGGHRAVVEAGIEETDETTEPDPGEFTVDRRTDWVVDRREVEASLESDSAVILDTRQAREYAGGTPYGEARGGHLPGAKHLHYRALLGSDGRLRSPATVRRLLDQRGITPDERVIAYCTGGVRSAWMTVVLQYLGYGDVANYAGSMWEWAAGEGELESE